MKHLLIFATVCLLSPISSCSKAEEPNTEQKKEQPIPPPEEPNNADKYVLQGSLQASKDLTGADYNQINQYMKRSGWDYSEHPNSSVNDHKDGIHGEIVYEGALQQYVFKLSLHANAEVADGDRGEYLDRQRNEMKSQTGAPWHKLNGNWGEWQKLEWKIKLPRGFQPSTSFCHIHQLKAQEGNNGSPLITITARSDKDLSNRRIQVIHRDDPDTQTVLIDHIKLEEFEEEWIQIETEMHYTHDGFFRITMTRISDRKVLVQQSFDKIDLWRKGAISIRNKFGVYRSFGTTMKDKNDRPQNGIKDDHILLADFKAYEKGTNQNPQAHD